MQTDLLANYVWIGVDIGTTGVRAIAYQPDGKSIAAAEALYPLDTPHPDWAEQNPAQIYDAVEKVVKETADALRYKRKVLGGVALSAVMHSFAAMDEERNLLTNMMTWADSRSSDIVQEMKQDEALCQKFYQKTCCPVHACYPLTKILWLRKHHPDLFKRMRYVGSIKDYVFANFTGEWVIDKSAASSTGIYNAEELKWDEEILRYIGITENHLPPVVSTTYKQMILPEVAERLHLPAGIPIVVGATDGVLVNVGIGAVKSGQISATIGTSGALRMLTAKPKVDPAGRTWCYNLTDDMWVAGGAINNGGIVLRWLRDKVCHYGGAQMENLDIDAYDLMTMKAGRIDAGADGLIMLPFFTGERAPHWNSELRAMFFGLSLNHGRSHMIRAALEGICYSLNSVLVALRDFGPVEDIRVSGSFTKSPLWLQIMSDVFNEEITLPDNSEGAAFGAAVLGFISVGVMKGIEDTANLVQPKKIYRPQPEDVLVYEQLYKIYERLYTNVQSEFAAIAAYQKNI